MRVLIIIVVILGLFGGAYLFVTQTDTGAQLLSSLPGGSSSGSEATRTGAGAQGLPEDLSTVQIRPAESILGEVSASGNIDLVSRRAVAMQVAGEVNEIAVKPGDVVAAGDLLLAVDTTALERDAQRARLEVESAKNQVDQLTEPADAADVAAAEADLAEAQENLADTEAGPSAEEIAAARSALESAQAHYDELMAGPSDVELTQLSADLKKKEVALTKAQGDYDQIAWQNSAGMTSQAVDLEQATIDYESAQAAYEEATQPASDSDIASAESSIQDAQVKVDDLLASPTEAEIAQARAQVAQAEAALAELQTGPSDLDLSDANITLEKAVVDLEEAYNDLAMAQVTAPIDGTVLEVDTEVGERVSSNAIVAVLADTSLMELTIDVAEIDIAKVQPGQPATIEIDALPDQAFEGVVDYIEPASDDSSGLVNYPVTIRLDAASLAGVRPGMTAVATLMNTSTDLAAAWLVPSNALRRGEGGASITVVRDGMPQPVSVDVGSTEGDWIVVRSPELRDDDQVVGSVTTFVGDNNFRFPGGMGGPPSRGPQGGGR
jgi:HlyD family secretion protein